MKARPAIAQALATVPVWKPVADAAPMAAAKRLANTDVITAACL
ncbi:MAG TPA: hypothetical protein VF332_06885 [Vicinamibacterales bacterium]|jgi:hypothetical protein